MKNLARGRVVARIMAVVPFSYALLCLFFAPLSGQYYYEQNKVQTKDYHFRVLQTAHFKIYFYDGGEQLATYTASVAEEFYKSISVDLGVQQTEFTPIIVYNSPNEFAQTNVLEEIIEEGVGGFSELFKNRVVVPFDGSYARYHHVLCHEITHIFEFELFYQPQLSSVLSLVTDFQMPQWVAEGFAEYASGSEELDSRIFMRDLVINDRLLSVDRLNDIYGYLSYREGEAIFRYIEDHYGRKKVFEVMHQLRQQRSVDDAFKQAFGLSSKKFSEEFEDYLRTEFWPQVVKKPNFKQVATLLTDHVADHSVYNTSPAISPSGSKIAFISDRNEYNDVYVISALDGKVLSHLVSGERSGGFESVHPYRGGISWSPDETRVVLAGKANGRDCLTIVAFPSGKVLKRAFLDVDGIYSPEFSPDGKRIAFVGYKDGYSDIYVYRPADGELERKTADVYEDRDPCFSPGGDSILFVSDRPDSGLWHPGSYALFMRSEQFAPARVSPRAEYLAYPAFVPNTSLLAFVTSDSSYDLCIYSPDSSKIVRRSSFLGGIYYPSFSRAGDRLIVSYYNNLGWDIGAIRDPLAALGQRAQDSVKAPNDTLSWEPEEPDTNRIKPYGFSLTPDYALGQASYGNDLGLSGYIDLALSDVLGNHRFYVTTDLQGDILNSDFAFSYWNLRGRNDFGVGIYQQFNYLYYYNGDIERLRDLGFQFVASHPFNKYARVELGPSAVARLDEVYLWDPFNQTYVLYGSRWLRLFLLDAAYVFDNSYWGVMTSPERGTRSRVGIQGSFLSSLSYITAYADYRNYIKIAPRFIWANRLLGSFSFGRDAEKYYIGGEEVRGYLYSEFSNAFGSNVAVLNSELRVPFVDRLKLAFPLPIDITDIRGVVFADAGLATDRWPRIYDSRLNRLRDLKVGFGAGMRFQISYFLLKLDWGWPISALSIDPTTNLERKRYGTWYFSLGLDF